MSSDELRTALDTGYVCPTEAGPDWRAAVAQGIDMSLVELNLSKDPWQRLLDHDKALALMLTLREIGQQLHE